MIDDGRRRDVDREDTVHDSNSDDLSGDSKGSNDVEYDVGETDDIETGRPEAKEGDDD